MTIVLDSFHTRRLTLIIFVEPFPEIFMVLMFYPFNNAILRVLETTSCIASTIEHEVAMPELTVSLIRLPSFIRAINISQTTKQRISAQLNKIN